MALRARLQSFFVRVWSHRGPTALLLWPLALLHRAYRAFDVWRYRTGVAKAERLPVPVVVIGNLYVGGTGKTPLTIELVRALRARGWMPGVVSRGYGAQSKVARVVPPAANANEYGDEPVLIARAAAVPVAVGSDRVAAAKLLLNLHPQTNLIIADDGLQHRRLGRDVEIALVHDAGFGNGWMLPAGPLREPPRRLDGIDAVVLHGETPPVRIYSPFYRMETKVSSAYALTAPDRRVPLTEFAAEQRAGHHHVIVAAGIGRPQRFYAMLRAYGIEFQVLALNDHYDYSNNPFAGRTYDRVLLTEKDAVKCAANPALANDIRMYVVPLEARIDTGLIDLIEARIKPAPAPTP